MPFNGAGTFTLVAGNPVVTGTVISSTVQNNTMTDIANGLTDCLTKDGQSTPTVSIPMGGFTINSLGNAVNPQDALTLSQTKGRLLNVQRFTVAGSFTYTPTTGTSSVVVELLGGGAGGGGCGATSASQAAVAGGGGAGSYARGRFTSAFSGVTVTIGAGGNGGGAGANPGIAGGTTSFGALMSAPGGNAGPAGTAGVPPLSGSSSNVSGTPTGANIISGNGPSSTPGVAASLTSFVPSSGAASPFGGGGIAFPSPGGGGQNSVSTGAGGGAAASGPSQAGFAGGSGFAGIAVIYEFGTAATVA